MTQEQSKYLLHLFNSRFGKAKWRTVEGGTDYDYLREDDTLYIYFQWSNQAEDNANNFDFPATPYRDMEDKWYAHRGFLRGWKNAEPHLADIIMDETIKKVIIVGYSHGAALATLAHEYVWYNRPDLRESLEGYGFGCPRVFWGKLTDTMKERWANFHPILNKNDIVTHVPPSLFGFKHVGEPINIDSKTTGWKFFWDAHMWEAYEQGLKNAVEEEQ